MKTRIAVEMGLAVVNDGDNLLIELDGEEFGRVEWSKEGGFRACTKFGWVGGAQEHAATAIADLFGPSAPAICDRVTEIERIDHLESNMLAPFGGEPVEPKRQPKRPKKQPPTKPLPLPTLPAFGAMPEG